MKRLSWIVVLLCVVYTPFLWCDDLLLPTQSPTELLSEVLSVPNGVYQEQRLCDSKNPYTVYVKAPAGLPRDTVDIYQWFIYRNGTWRKISSCNGKKTYPDSLTFLLNNVSAGETIYLYRDAFLEDKTEANNIVNGDFEAGDKGFYSQYDYRTPQKKAVWEHFWNYTEPLNPEGVYTVDVGMKKNHSSSTDCNTDHTYGLYRVGKAMWINGGGNANTIVWQQPIPIKAGKNYMFSVWALNWSVYPLAKLQWFIDNKQIGNIETPPAERCTWKRIATVWNSGTSDRTVTLSLRNQVTETSGNDFAIDDIALRVMTHEPYLVKITFCGQAKETLCSKDAPSVSAVEQYIQQKYPCTGGTSCKWEYNYVSLLQAVNNGGTVPMELYANQNFTPNNFVSNRYRTENVLLTIEKPTRTISDKKVICAGDSYRWPWNTPRLKNQSFTTTGIYKDTIRYASGCDKEYYILDLQVLPFFPTKELDTIICQYVGGVNWNIAGHNVWVSVPNGKTFVTRDYYVPYSNHYECDSIKLRLNVHVDTDPTIVHVDTPLCYGQQLLWPTDNGYMTIKTPGFYTIIEKQNRLCPRTTYLNVRYNGPPKKVERHDGVCKGGDYTWQTYRTKVYRNIQVSADYFDTLRCKHSPCDSICYHLRLDALSPITETLYDTVCEKDMPYRFHPIHDRQPLSLGQLRTDSIHNIVFSYTGKNCDSVHYKLNLHIYKSKVVQRDTSVPYGAIFKWIPFNGSKGQYIKQVTSESYYYDTLRAKDKRRCDSIRYVLHVTSFMPNGKFFDGIVCAGETYQWRRENYLPVIPIQQEYDERDYADTVRYHDMPTVDSAYYYLHLVVQKPTTVEECDTICAGTPYYWRDPNKPILLEAPTGDYYDTLRSFLAGCDSIRYHLHLVRQAFTTEEITDTVCKYDTYRWTTDRRLPPKEITEGVGLNTYYDTIRTVFGCDSVRYVLHLLRKERIDKIVDTTIGACRLPYKWYTRDPLRPIFVTTLDNTATLLHRVEMLPYSDGRCDSVWYELFLHVERPIYITEEDTVCEIKHWYTRSPNYYQTIVATKPYEEYRDTACSQEGCDSVIYTLKLWAYPPRYDTIIDTICGEDTYYWDRHDKRPVIAINSQEKYTTHHDTLLRTNGCDSVRYTLHLVRLHTTHHYTYDTLCHDETYDWYDTDGRQIRTRLNPMDETTNYIDIVPYRGTRNCDSLICHLSLTRQPVFYTTLTDTICGNTDYVWVRNTTETTYYDTIRQTIEYSTYRDTIHYVSTGCDSAVYVLNLLRRDVRLVTENVTLCAEDDYDWYTDNKSVPYQIIHAKDHLDTDTAYYYMTYYGGTQHCDSVLYELNVHTNVITYRDTLDTTLVGSKYVWVTKDTQKPMNIYCPTGGLFEYNDKASYMNGCDSVRYHLQLLVQDYTYRCDTDTVCGSDTYFWSTDVINGRVIEIPVDSMGQDFYDTIFHAGTKRLDSVRYSLHLVRHISRDIHVYDTICFDGDYTWNVNGHSFYIQHPTSFPQQSEVIERSDVAYYSGTQHCDSIHYYLHLLRHRIYFDIEHDTTEATICYGATYEWYTKDEKNPIIINQTTEWGTYRDEATFMGSAHCDSIQYQLLLHVVQPMVIEKDTFCCEGEDFEWKLPHGEGWRVGRPIWHRPMYTCMQQNVLWRDTVKSFKTECGLHCDSIYYILRVNVIQTQDINEEVTICQGDTFEWHTWRTQYLTTDGTYTDKSFNDETHCADRAYNLRLHVTIPTIRDTFDTMCAGDRARMWIPNKDFSSRYLLLDHGCDTTLTIPDMQGCDSLIYNMHLLERTLTEDNKIDTVCIPYTGLNGVLYDWYGTDGTYRKQINLEYIQPDGNYVDVVRNEEGSDRVRCDSIHYHLHLDLQRAAHKIITDTICEDSIYRLRNEQGVILTTFKQLSTTEQVHLFDVPYTTGCKSCDSVHYEVHLLRQKDTVKYDTALIVGDADYVWNYSAKCSPEIIPIQATATGDYGPIIETYSGTHACDSVWHFLHLMRYDVYVRTESRTLCEGDSYDWYTSDTKTPRYTIRTSDILADDTTYHDVLQAISHGIPWDSVHYNLKVHINRVLSREQTDTVSIDSLYRWQPDNKSLDRTITPKAGLEDHFYTSYYTTGCDSVHYTLHLLCQDYTIHHDTDTVCGTDTYKWYTETGILLREIIDEGDYFDTLHYIGTHHCDSVRYSLHLLRQRPKYVHTIDTVCGDETYYWETYTGKVNELHPQQSVEDFYDVAPYTGTHSCDSICYSIHLVRQDTTIEQLIDTICVGRAYEWYTKSGLFIRQIRQQGTDGDYEYITYYDGTRHCEKIHYRLHLHVNKPIFSDEEASFCKGQPYTWYNTDGSIIDIISQQADIQYHSALSTYTNGCDSVYHTLKLNMLYPSKGWESNTICFGSSYSWHGRTYTRSTIAVDVLPNIVGCDSTCTMVLNVLPDVQRYYNDTFLCPSSYIDWMGQRITTAGTYNHTLSNILGCDSIRYQLQVNPHDTTATFDEVTMCYQDLPCYWHLGKYYESGEYTDTLINSQGCDSICHLRLNVSEPIEYCIVDTLLCLGKTMDWHGYKNIYTKGVFRDTFRNQNGCDSVLFELNVDTVDCCIHLRNLQLVPQGDVCGDDAKYDYRFLYTSGKPDSFSVSFEEVALSSGFQNQHGYFVEDSITPSEATLQVTLPTLKPFIRPSEYHMYVEITDTCGTMYPFYDTLQVFYPSWVIDQHWNDVLAVLAPQYMMGYSFYNYQWYKNDTAVVDAIGDHYYMPSKISQRAEYRVRLTRTDDDYTTFTCPVTIHSVSDSSVLRDPYIFIYPSEVSPKDPRIHIITNMNGDYWIYDLSGKIIQKGAFTSYENDGGACVITAPRTPATYILYAAPEKGGTLWCKPKGFIVIVK